MGAAGHMQPLLLTAVAVTQAPSHQPTLEASGRERGRILFPLWSSARVGWPGGVWASVVGNGGG